MEPTDEAGSWDNCSDDDDDVYDTDGDKRDEPKGANGHHAVRARGQERF